MKQWIAGIGVVSAALALVACDGSEDLAGPVESTAATVRVEESDSRTLESRRDLPSIAAIAETTPGFSILYAALDAAGLVDTFEGRRQFTVFAPTDDAFIALLGDLDVTAEELLADTELLTAVLLYHVTPGNRNATSVVRSPGVRMLNGQTAPTSVVGDQAYIDGAAILATDIRASNGTIHVIDSVLVP